MKKCLPLLAAIVACLCPIHAFAASGNIEIQLTEKEQGERISCSKVGDMVNGMFVLEEAYEESGVDLNHLSTASQLEMAARTLQQYVRSGTIVTIDAEGKAVLPNLEEGVYLIRLMEQGKKEMLPTLVFLPTWEEEAMQYDITVVPKCSVWGDAPKTGDNCEKGGYGGILLISFIIVVGLSCHNRFKCDRIHLSISKKGGYTNGNDNDTENPRCPRRIGLCGCRSIN